MSLVFTDDDDDDDDDDGNNNNDNIITIVVAVIVRASRVVNLTNFGRDLKPDVKVILDVLKQGINCWDCCIYFIVPEN